MIDLYSDTQSMPSPAMRQAIASAEVGDEQQGTDPTVNRLLETVAELLGKESALFLPSGTMCNEISIKVHTNPGETVLADRMGHILRSEAGAPGLLSGVLIDQLNGDRGIYTPDQVKSAITDGSFHVSKTTLLCAEQTHVFGGGTIWPLEQLQAVSHVAKNHGLATHLDGARLLNASVATRVPAADFAAGFDSVWIDLTKGLGCPVGAVLAGSSAFIQEARRYKHVFGGAMRQAGIIAAAGVYALQHNVERLADDHANASRFAAGIDRIPNVIVENPEPDSNIVIFDITDTGKTDSEIVDLLADCGVRLSLLGHRRMRAVTFLGITSGEIDRAIGIIAEFVDDHTNRLSEGRK